MKFTLTLFAILVTIGLGQAHQFADFGKGPLHEDFQDFLNLLPVKKINNIVADYVQNDPEVKAAIRYLLFSGLLKQYYEELERIPEFINYLDYLHKEGIEVYLIINEINKVLGIKELEPPTPHANSTIQKRTGGIVGYFTDLAEVFPTNDFIHLYAQKLKTSPAYIKYIDQLKSDNFQQFINKYYKTESLKIILNYFKNKGINTQISEDIMFIVLGITVPN